MEVYNTRLVNVLQKQAHLCNQEFAKTDAGISDVEADSMQVTAVITGPEQTPYAGGRFRVRLSITSSDFPATPPKVHFLTKIFHPNINISTGDVCVNTIQKDWDASNWSISHILRVVRCLLIIPFPESALNEEAAKLFMESYEEFAEHANMMKNLHAAPRICIADENAAPSQAKAGGSTSPTKAAKAKEAKAKKSAFRRL